MGMALSVGFAYAVQKAHIAVPLTLIITRELGSPQLVRNIANISKMKQERHELNRRCANGLTPAQTEVLYEISCGT